MTTTGRRIRTTEVLHYVGCEDDRGGIVSHLRVLSGAAPFRCVLGVNRGFVQRRPASYALLELPPLNGESIGPATYLRSRAVASEVAGWLAADPRRIFHGHSRAGLLVGIRLARAGIRRCVVSVHCYGRRRWFYRYAARRMGRRMFWLTPRMKAHYGVRNADTWDGCVPSCVPAGSGLPGMRRISLQAPRAPAGDAAFRTSTADGVPAGIRLGGIGMLVPWKGWHLVLDAFAALPAETRRRVRFDHIGSLVQSPESRDYAAFLLGRTRELGLMDRVSWHGEEDSSARLIASIDCLLVPSIAEPQSLAALEALMGGVPVLATDAGGVRDVIPPGAGWLFRSGDAGALAEGIRGLVDGSRLAEALVDPAQLARFTGPAVAAEWEAIYAGLLTMAK